MRYDEFLKYAEEHFLEYMPEEYRNASVEINHINNGTEQHYSLSLKKPYSTISIMPAIRMESFFYDMEKNGISLRDCMKDIANVYQEALEVQETMGVPDLSKENLLQNLFIVAVNYEAADLTETPYMRVHDLAIIAKSQIMENAVATITDRVAEFYGMNGEELLQMAIENNAKFSKPVMATMSELIFGEPLELNEKMPSFDTDSEFPMYVLTNEDSTYGAAFISDKNVLDMAAKKLKDDLFIIPSSVHELIIIPKSQKYGPSLSEIKLMVEEANQTMVDPKDFLSNNVYVYDAKARELKMYVGGTRLQKEPAQSREKKMSGPKL